MPAITFIDVWLVLFAAPVLLLIGVPAVGYLAGAGAWIALRAAGVQAERRAAAIGDISKEMTARLFYVLGRVVLLAVVVIVVRKSAGKHDALAALIVIAAAFTVQLGVSIVNRPRRPAR